MTHPLERKITHHPFLLQRSWVKPQSAHGRLTIMSRNNIFGAAGMPARGVFTSVTPPKREGASSAVASGLTSSSIYKAVIPKFLYKPPYGYPRFVDIPELRRLSATPFIAMCIQTIVDEIAGIEWDIVPRHEEASESHIEEVQDFFDNPNVNKENFNQQLRKIIRDILEVDSGVWVKVFDRMGKFKELFVYDGGTFTKNPDMFGTFADRAEIIPGYYGAQLGKVQYSTETGYSLSDEGNKWMQEAPAYFQYGWITGARPMPFGSREIIYLMRNPRSENIYGRSPVEILVNVIQMLVYGVDYNLDYFMDNNIPKGVFKMIDADKAAVDRFKEQWQSVTKMKNEVGDWRQRWWKMPIISTDGAFERIQFSNVEMELISQQQWFTKLIWACFGLNPSELGYTENSNKAVDSNQSKVFKRKAIKPILQLLEFHINTEIIWQEFHEDVKFQFDTYDLDDDMSKHQLYELQIKNGIRTVNEVREEMDLQPVDGGDEIKKPGGFNPFQKLENEGGKLNFENEEEENEKKSLNNPTLIGQHEVPYTEERMAKAIKYAIKEIEKAVLEQLKMYMPSGPKNLERIKELTPDIIKKLKSLVSLGTTEEIVKSIIKNSFLKSLNKAEQEMEMNFVPNQKTIDFLQNYTFENVKGISEDLKNKLQQELSRGVMEGEGITKLKNRVKKVFDVGDIRAKAIARTEVNRAENIAHLEGYKQAGIPGKKRWIATMDSKTCATCKALNGQEVKLTDKFEAKGWEGEHGPQHVNCRCRIVFVPGD